MNRLVAAVFCCVVSTQAAPTAFLSGSSLGVVPVAKSLGAQSPDGVKSAAILALREILKERWDATGNEDIQATSHPVFVDSIGNRHIRAKQYLNGLPVHGASLMIHVHPNGTVFAVNGELTPDDKINMTEPLIDCESAVKVARKQSEILNSKWISECELGAVHGKDDVAHMAFKRMIGWQPSAGPYQKAILFASIVNGDLLAFHLKTYGARSLETYGCFNTETHPSTCTLISNSSDPIDTNDSAVNDAHNYAIMVYDFLQQYGRDSLDNTGLPLVSLVHYGAHLNSASWLGELKLNAYGDGDDVTYSYFSRALDIVGHEFAHGVTESESALVYSGESGALNEAFSDIIGAAMEAKNKADKGEDMIWEIGEDVSLASNFTSGFRNMADPQKHKQHDFYFDRYRGSLDEGGIHYNSGIMNLAFALMVKGGFHPRGKTVIEVPPINPNFTVSLFQATKIMYDANVGCLTESSNFRAARECTLTFAMGFENSVTAAWDAVGVRPLLSLSDNVPKVEQALYKGGIQEYTLEDVKGGFSVICNVSGTTGDPDLYIRFDDHPEPFSFSTLNDCSSDLDSSPSTSCATGPSMRKKSTAYIMLKAYESLSDTTTLTCYTQRVCAFTGKRCKTKAACCNKPGPMKLTCDLRKCVPCKKTPSRCQRDSECCSGFCLSKLCRF